jgi:hypothetical protein
MNVDDAFRDAPAVRGRGSDANERFLSPQVQRSTEGKTTMEQPTDVVAPRPCCVPADEFETDET